MNRATARLAFYLALAAALSFVLPSALPFASAMPYRLPVQLAHGSIDASPSLPASAASSPAIEHINSVGGIFSTFAISGTLAFLIQGYALTILDLSAPSSPISMGHMPLVRSAETLAVANGIVYVVADRNVQIIDAHNPALPIEAARYTSRASAIYAIQISGGFAYLTTADSVEIVDVRTPAHPTYVATYTQSPGIADFFVRGSLAYIVDRTNILTIVDLSNPSAPNKAGMFTLSSPAQTSFYDLTIQGQRVYINAYTSDGSGITHPRLVTLEITQPTSPVLLGNVEIGIFFFSATFFGNIGYLDDVNGLQILDVSDPAHPVARGRYPGTIVHGGEIVQVVGSRVYFVDNRETLRILDATNLDNASVLGSYTTPPGLKSSTRIQVVGSTGYVLSQGLQVLDLTDPISPTLRGFYPSELENFAQVIGSHAYLENNSNALDLLDITNPDLPTRIATLTIGSVHAVAEANNRAYILTAEGVGCGKFCIIIHNMLTIFDISNPSSPLLEGRTLLFDSSRPDVGNMVVKGSIAYVAGGGALRVVDVSTPATPMVRLNYPLAGIGNLMQMVGGVAYVTSSAGLTILDVTDPLKPNLLGQTGSLGYVYSIQVQGSLVFVDGTSGIRVVDISDPRRPIPRAADEDWGGIGQVAVHGDIIYVAEGLAGLVVLRLYPDRFPPPMFVPLARH